MRISTVSGFNWLFVFALFMVVQIQITAGASNNSTTSGASVNATNSGTSVEPIPSGAPVNAKASGGSANVTTSGTPVNATTSRGSANTTTSGASINATTSGTSDNVTISGASDNATISVTPDPSNPGDTPTEDPYVTLTGRTRDELIDSGEYFELTSFENSYRVSIGERQMDMYIPLHIRQEEPEEHPAMFTTFEENFKWPETFNEHLRSLSFPENSVKFILFTKYSPPEGEILNIEDVSTIRKSSFDPAAYVKVLIHGYNENPDSHSGLKLKDAYLKAEFYDNLIVVDWTALANNPMYYEAAMATKYVSEEVAEFILTLCTRRFTPSFYHFHLIGFCLGAHVAGQAGLYVKNNAVGQQELSRITGLDPAGLGFINLRNELLLDSTDALFVDIIHSNMGKDFSAGYFGVIHQNTGKSVNFFPNGGREQQTCGPNHLVADLIHRCSHYKAVDFYIRSIGGEKFQSCSCNSWAEFSNDECVCLDGPYMGEYLRTVHPGRQYLYVNERAIADVLGLMDDDK